jgi:ATP-dependent Clp protease ATP-binding subunit ClpA
MITRLSPDARKMVLISAAQEARRRGDRRLGTDHLLLALLHDEDSSVARAVGVDLEAARAASDSLDQAALVAVGVNVTHLGAPPPSTFTRRRLLPLTSGARAVLKATVEQTRRHSARQIQTRHFLLALLEREVPDPCAELLAALGVDRSQVRSRLEEPGESG